MESVVGQRVLVVGDVGRLVDGRQLEQVGLQRVPGRGREHIGLVGGLPPVGPGQGRVGSAVEERQVLGRGGGSREGRQSMQKVMRVHVVSVIHLWGSEWAGGLPLGAVHS